MKPRSARVLVVDDDPAMLRTVERILSPRHHVLGCASGEEAIEAIKREPYDVAIVDVRMPGLDGFEVTRAIRSLRPRTEVILVTGSVTDLDDKLVKAIEERAFYFITKPFSKTVLTSLVSWCLDMQRLAEERDDLIHRLTEDLERARRFQRALLPQGLPKNFGTVRAASAWVSTESLGGDLYDIVPLAGDRLFLIVADVAGHGVAAALLVGMIKTAIGRGLQEMMGATLRRPSGSPARRRDSCRRRRPFCRTGSAWGSSRTRPSRARLAIAWRSIPTDCTKCAIRPGTSSGGTGWSASSPRGAARSSRP